MCLVVPSWLGVPSPLLSQRKHRLAYSSAPSSVRFSAGSAFWPRKLSCGLEVRSIIFIVYFWRINPCKDFEISEDRYFSSWSDIYRSVCSSPFLPSNFKLSTFFFRLAFTKAEKLPPPTQNEERWILSPDPKVVQEVNVSIGLSDRTSPYASIPQAKQETMLVQDPNDPNVYSFAVRILWLWLILGFL